MKRSIVACVAIVAALMWVVGGVAGASAVQGATPASGCAVTSEADNEALAQRWLDAWDSGDPAAFSEVIADDYIHGWAQGQDTQGADAFLARYTDYTSAIADFDTSVTLSTTEDDVVTVVWTTSGTHSGALFGVEPTGNTLTWTGVSVFRIECGEIVENWTEMDVLSIQQQIGLPGVPTTPAA